MENLLFFLRDKKRLKFLLICMAIGLPLLLATGFLVNYYEDGQSAKGTENDKGGLDYYYRESSGAKELPEMVSKIVPIYTNGETTYYNVSNDGKGKLGGNLYTFTKDDFSKIKEFYKPLGKIVDEEDNRLEFEKNGIKIIISKEEINIDDPIKDVTKFNVLLSINNRKNFKLHFS